LTLTIANNPLNSNFVDSGNGSGSFTFNPDFSQAGVYNVTFRASDGSLLDTEVVQITVTGTNLPPVLDSIRSKTVAEGSNLTFRVHATDPDGNTLTLTAANVPTNATFFDSGNGAGSFIFNPSFIQAGVYNVTFRASDGSLLDSEVVSITVTNTNLAPVLDSIRSKTVAEGANLTFRVHATDPDGTPLTLTVANNPLNSTFVDSGNGAGSFSFNPDFTQAGVYNVTFRVSDGTLVDSEVVQITVNSTNLPPVLDPIGSKSVAEGAILSFRVHASDPDGIIPMLTATNIPLNGILVDSGNGAGSFRFTPSFTQDGVYNVTFKASDGSLSDSEIVLIIVIEAGNQAPILDSIGSKTVAEGSNLSFRAHASDPDGTVPTLTASNVPLNAAFFDSSNGAGSFSFNPNFTQAGVYNVTFKASDGILTDSEVVQITVTNTNRAPILDSIRSRTVIEGNTLAFSVTASDPDGAIPSLSATNVPTNASFTDNGNGSGSFSFSPNFAQAGVYNINFKASDGLLIDSELVQITVLETGNQPPVLDSIGPKTVAENSNLTFRFHASDPDGTSPALQVKNNPANSTFIDSGNGSGSFSFNPNFTQGGVYNVTFKASDGSLSDSEIVTITVTNVNRAPVLDSIRSKTVAEGAILTFRVHATDPDPEVLTLTALNKPTNSTFIDSGNGAGSLTFAPSFTQTGIYNVTFKVNDSTLSDSEIVQITVTEAGNQSPLLDSIGSKTVAEGANLSFRLHATDPDGTTPALTAIGVPTNATFVDSGNGAGSFVFNPNVTQSGVYNVSFRASDGSLLDTEVVTITVTNFNQAPVLDSIRSKTVAENSTLSFRVHATDPDGTIPTFTTNNVPLNATFVDSGNGAGSFTFSPDFTQAGVYNVTFRANDGSLVDSEVVAITVTNTNRAPVLDSIGSKTVGEGTTLAFRVHGTDPDGTIPTLTAANVPLNATFMDSGNGAGSFSFTPNFTQAGVYNVTFRTSDGSLLDTEVVQITVTPNQAPILDSIGSKSIVEGINLTLRIHATDPEANPLILTATNLPTRNATFFDSGNGAGAFSFTPDFQQGGSYSIKFKVTDGDQSDSEIVQLTVVEAGNQAPVVESIGPKTVKEGDSLIFTVRATDPDGTIPTLTMSGTPPNASFVNNGDGTGLFKFKPSFFQAGTVAPTFVASDGSLSDFERVTITVQDVNLPPSIDSIPPKTVEEAKTLQFTVIGRDSTDADGGPLFLIAINLPVNATFTDSGNGKGVFRFTPDSSQIGVYNVTFNCTDAESPALTGSRTVQITVIDVNRAPVLATIGFKIVTEGNTLSFAVYATDPDGTYPTLSASPLPRGAVLVDSLNGKGSFTWTPDFAQAGLYSITFKASDGALEDKENVFIQVRSAGNQKPILASIGSQSVTEGGVLNVSIDAADPDSTIPAISAKNLPNNVVFGDQGNGHANLVFTPLYNQAGVYFVTVLATDDSAAVDSEVVQITVNEAGNQRPTLVPLDSQTVKETQNLKFKVSATDPDSTIPRLRATNLPANAVFVDSANGRGSFSFTPSNFQAGLHKVIFSAVDAQDSSIFVSDTVPIAVLDSNQLVIFTSGFIGDKQFNEGDSLKINVSASDPDSTIPKMRMIISPSGAQNSVIFVDNNNGTANFTFKPGFKQAGTYFVLFYAVDAVYTKDTTYNFPASRIIVFNVNRPPEISPIGNKSVIEGATLSFTVTAVDTLDNTTPILSAANLPKNSNFTNNGNGTGSFNFAPVYNQAGNYSVTFIASDGVLADTEIITITVTEAGNHAPILAALDTFYYAFPDDSLMLAVTATDPDSTIPVLTTSSLPANATFVNFGNGTGSFKFKPDTLQTDSAYFVTFTASDGALADSHQIRIQVLSFLPGDANGDGKVGLADIIYLVNHIFKAGPAPTPPEAGDANNDGKISLADIVYLVNFVFKGGPPPQ